MKARIQYLLQRVLGLETYLFLFSWFKIKTLRYDSGENDFFHFLSLIPQGSSILDIGGNIGIMSYHLCKIPGSEVISFEPIPQNVRTLKRIKQFFNLENLDIREMALGNTSGHIDMVMPVVDKVRKQGLSHVLTDEIKEFNEGMKFEVPIDRIDNLSAISNKNIAAVKLDVENFEYQVLLGAVEMLEECHPVIYCELWDNENRTNCFQLLSDMGYGIFVLFEGILTRFDHTKHRTQNFFFIED